MSRNDIIQVFKPTFLKIVFFFVIGYFVVPVFSQPSLCLGLLAENPYDTAQPSYRTLSCVKLTTVSEQMHPISIVENGVAYQKTVLYSYDLDSKYYAPVFYGIFVYFVSCCVGYGATTLLRFRKKLRV